MDFRSTSLHHYKLVIYSSLLICINFYTSNCASIKYLDRSETQSTSTKKSSHIVITIKKVHEMDFTDELPSGFRFNPTDSELIVDYLKPKIESRGLPKCRLHEVNIYNRKPEELAEGYRSHENKWYFLTSRDRKYCNGNRPDRSVGGFGYWKTTQKHKHVYDQTTGQMVGYKRMLVFYDNNKHKTMWLMHEYTTNEPNLPVKKGETKLNDWVLCKIYKKEQTTNSEEEGGKKVIQEPNRTNDDIHFPKRRRVSESSKNTSFSNHPQQVDVQETNGTHVEMDVSTRQSVNPLSHVIPNPMQPITTFQASLIQRPQCYDQNQFTWNARNDCQISDSTSRFINPIESSFAQTLDDGAYTKPTTVHGLRSLHEPVKSDQCFDRYMNSLSDFLFSDDYTPVLAQKSYEVAPTLLADDVADHFHFPKTDASDASISAPNEFVDWSMDILGSCLDDVNTTDC